MEICFDDLRPGMRVKIHYDTYSWKTLRWAPWPTAEFNPKKYYEVRQKPESNTIYLWAQGSEHFDGQEIFHRENLEKAIILLL